MRGVLGCRIDTVVVDGGPTAQAVPSAIEVASVTVLGDDPFRGAQAALLSLLPTGL
ncbi:hypothetical protein GS491_23515 [Rhodococcus hoagii]|nr:hypothetical protein [Prescottella equi]